MALSSSFVYFILAAFALKKLADVLSSKGKRAPYPPGPKPLPLIGNALDFPSEKFAQNYADWAKKYDSPIVHAESLGNHVVVLNKLEDAIELLEVRAKLYSDRPTLPIFPLMGWDFNVALMPYGDMWRQHRRICQQNFNPQAVRKYESLQTEKVQRFLRSLLETPQDFETHNKIFSVSLTTCMMYGYDIKSVDDRVIEVAEEGNVIGGRLVVPGGSLINIFPFLKHIPAWFPGASSHKAAVECKKLTEEMMRIPTDFVKKSLAEGTAVPSLVTDFYERKYAVGASEEEEELIKNVAYTVYGAASDTTISASNTFICQMVLNPDVQRKAQEEIDRVVGSKRLPTFEDRKSLPYLEAIYREVLRFKPPIPISVAHAVTEDDHYKGYLIPKGTVVYPNIWAMSHDEEVYTEPFAFNPDRFFDENGKLNDDDRILAYGFGRRICVGKSVASTSLWLQMATTLACFTMSKAKDANGKEIEVDTNYEESGLLIRKEPFACSFTVRSPAARKLVLDPN
ncbi:Cytochrome P450 monooxygenase 98 [Psilocybe cubensis]|uniref:Cytochrome P450 n=2 Tax=Psilocybe cubensis TaxID=181762 RepID=A0A8H7XWB2_PSICU|nr:Cytochrome P450 monooxygenase 98 [Psilocybe cubensis]KAH9478395.1 Cytochrome P450 monooxygenase 98 [Psilocybe cubensis]